MKQVKSSEVYTTSFCNQGHHVGTGHPINHECYVLNPQAIKIEREGDFDQAMKGGLITPQLLDPKKSVIIEG